VTNPATPSPDPGLSSLAEEAGLDTTRCELCGDPLDDSRPWKRGLDGCGAHTLCLRRFDA
jgi:hypothetical protein